MSEVEGRSDDEVAVAGAYDDLNRRFAIPFLDDLSKKPVDRGFLERFAKGCGGGRVLDVGCGTGLASRILSDLGLDVVGIDLSGEAIAQARRLSPTVRFEQTSFMDLAFETGSFAGAVAFFSLIHTPRPLLIAALSGIVRVVDPGGWLLLAVYEGEGDVVFKQAQGAKIDVTTTLYGADELAEALHELGFEVVESASRDPLKYETDSRRVFVLAKGGG